tara:strand:+ start:415 stop:765 length:351 start_codon:yes stop_codon:yes gene_type:complete
MSDIKLQPDWYNNALFCPVCGGNNLHQETVTMYDRVMDATTVLVTRTYAGNTSTHPLPEATAGNPSADRNALTIDFWCENCHGHLNDNPPEYTEYFKLAVLQHEGTTFLNWIVPKK